jgi:Protein of unknown function (DUF1254)
MASRKLRGSSVPDAAVSDPLVALATKAYIYGFPLVFNLNEVDGYTSGAGSLPVNAPYNTFAPARELLGPETTFVTPNNDTLYVIAALDLSAGPLVLHVPDTGDRYYVLQFVDAWTNNFAYIGQRATGSVAGDYLLAPVGYDGPVPAGATLVPVPTTVAMIVGRIAVAGADDLAAVHALQDQFTLVPLSDPPAGQLPDVLDLHGHPQRLGPILPTAYGASVHAAGAGRSIRRRRRALTPSPPKGSGVPPSPPAAPRVRAPRVLLSAPRAPGRPTTSLTPDHRPGAGRRDLTSVAAWRASACAPGSLRPTPAQARAGRSQAANDAGALRHLAVDAFAVLNLGRCLAAGRAQGRGRAGEDRADSPVRDLAGAGDLAMGEPEPGRAPDRLVVLTVRLALALGCARNLPEHLRTKRGAGAHLPGALRLCDRAECRPRGDRGTRRLRDAALRLAGGARVLTSIRAQAVVRRGCDRLKLR